MKQKRIKLLKQLWSYLNYHNNLAPFPPYCTEYVKQVKIEFEKMEKENINYDELPVAACKYCKSLHITVDELDNDICNRCGAVNEISIYKDIDDYLTRKDEDN